MGIQSLQLSKAPAKNKILISGLLFQIVRYCLIFIWLMRATLSINTGLYKGKPESRHFWLWMMQFSVPLWISDGDSYFHCLRCCLVFEVRQIVLGFHFTFTKKTVSFTTGFGS